MTDDTGLVENHLQQLLGVGLQKSLGQAGTIGARTWFTFHNGPNQPNEPGDDSLRKVDYTAFWQLPVTPLSCVVETGWTAHTFPQFRGDQAYTNEWYVSLSFDDSKLFKTDRPILNPYVTWYQDTDDYKGGWVETGISHTFSLREAGLDKTPILKDLAVTPSFLVAFDEGQLGGYGRAAEVQYGLQLCYDLSAALKMPAKYGQLYLTGFLFYRDGFIEQVVDRLYGGVGIGYQW